MGLRHRSIRFRVGILIAVPVLSLIALYFFAASFTLGGAIGQAHARKLRADLGSVGVFQGQLARERHLAMLSLARPESTAQLSAFSLQQTATGNALTALQMALRSAQVQDNASAQEKTAIGRLLSETNRLQFIRNDVLADAITPVGVLDAYDSIINAGFPVITDALAEQTNVPLVTQAQGLVNLARVGELAAEEGDLLSGAIEAGSFPSIERITFAELASQRQALANSTIPSLQPAYRSVVDASLPPSSGAALTQLENGVITTRWASGHTVPPGILNTPTSLGDYTAALLAGATIAGDKLQAQAQHQADTVFLQLLVAGALGLLGIIASVLLSLLLGRSLVRQLRELRASALVLANEQLPEVTAQLREGQPVDLSKYEQPAEPTNNEIEQVRQSFGVVQRAAIQSAVDESKLRKGVSEVFRNLAGRSLSLLQRQLTLLDGMERRATEPAELENLFRLDHLTTRMRRHAEGLIILSGNTPARAWRHPVQLIDVLRAAVAEVEDYTRIRVLSRTTASVAGHAVADVIHLIAELAENATVFSPPSTPVLIQGDLVGRGFAVEIEDRGLGISAARLAEINASLADPPQFDPAVSDQLGLFIAGQLAKRHDIKITLQPSVYGGTTAVVLIPYALVVDEDTDRLLPGAAQPDRLPGRHAALVPSASTREGNGHAASPSGTSYPPLSTPVAVVLPPGAEDDQPIEAGVVIDAAVVIDDTLVVDGTVVVNDTVAVDDTEAVDDTAVIVPPRADDERPASAPAPAPFPPRADDERPANGAGSPAAANGTVPFHSLMAALGEDDETHVSAAELAELGLPVRVRQASLAPQLRDSGSGSRAALGPEDTVPTLPAGTPEAARETMSALQRGWQLGRAEADNEIGDVPEPEPGPGGAASPG